MMTTPLDYMSIEDSNEQGAMAVEQWRQEVTEADDLYKKAVRGRLIFRRAFKAERARRKEIEEVLREVSTWIGEGENSDDRGCKNYWTKEYTAIVDKVNTTLTKKRPKGSGDA